ncbi:SusC/RagA family TonB-linked outer membrane protein [Polaribacter sp. MSW13]|uniref:SusC/RagA family TonB-linked outer membrane protein n=1 Tax=Polaribacter marinus TaxID=2916838 RepID=A0A9X1VK57_9FLAO|nr:SusC/RagA family TonB-linked outer membrane protein [Polaribacter marinus]MCI2227627.1 SusC/RagA family TonB-linked outer membrane protein [Polaribacter marinus]
MKKISTNCVLDTISFKFDLKMKLTGILLFFALFQMNANDTYSQGKKISLDLKSTTIEEVLNEIERKTDINFFYKNSAINLNKKIDVKADKISVRKILEAIFNTSNIKFEVFNKQIILREDFKQKSLVNILNKFVKQKKIISGTITDEGGTPLYGATVLIKGTRIATSTDFDGKYNIELTDAATTLVITYIGFKKQEIVINNRTKIDVQLKVEETDLDEIVVIGYGKVKKEELTGSVGSVDMKKISSQSPTINLDNALQGQVAGVNVTSSNGQPGAAARIRIRGTTSLLGSNQPLYVIDGIPVVATSNIPVGGTEGLNLGRSLDQQGISTPIGNINTADIESISILKDASAAAIYGSRAANGVIIITTKGGAYNKKPEFNFSMTNSFQNAQTLNVLNAAQFKDVWTTAVLEGTTNNAYTASVLDGSYFGNADTNWEDEVGPSSPISTNFNLNVSGGTAKTKYNTSLGVNKQDGVYKGSGFDRYSFNLNLDTDISDVWKFGSRVSISYADQQSVDGGLTQRTYNFRPDLPVLDENDNYTFSPQYNSENPMALSKAKNSNSTLFVLGSFFSELEIIKDLKFKTSLSVNYNAGHQYSFYPKFTFTGGWRRTGGDGDGYAQDSRSQIYSTLFQNELTYTKNFNDVHHFTGLAVVSFEKQNSNFTKAFGTGFSNDVLANVSSATVSTGGLSYSTNYGLESYIGRLDYDFASKYYVTLTGRVDGSSKFAIDNRYAFFPSAALAWRVSKEPFLEDVDFIDELKLRASIGKTGQQDFGPYAWRTLFETSFYGGESSVILTQLGNDKLKWETSNQFDLGLDFSLFKGKFTGELGYYTKKTIDALFTTYSPGSSGENRTIANIGDTRNSGLELKLNGSIIENDNFGWDMSVIVSTNKNRLVRIADDFKNEEGFLTGFPGGGILREGSPIGLIYGYRSEGIFQNQADIDALNAASPTGVYQKSRTSLGDLKFKDLTGPNGVPDGVITNLDQEVIGNAQADFFGSISSNFKYKNFTLSTFFTYSVGNDLQAFNLARDTNFSSTYIGENKVTSVLNAWSPTNTNTSIPRIVYGDPNDNDRLSSHYVYDASYIRLKNINISYSFSESLLKRLKYIKSLSIQFSAQNLLTFTNYPGADPEASNLYNNDISSGRDNNRYPLAKVFTTGVRIGF